MDKIIRIDMSTPGGPTVSEEPIGKYVGFGGRAMTSAIIHDEVPPRCHALGKENKLVIAPGLLAGSPASMSGRLSIGCKSPLTNGIKESNAGGQAAQHLGRLDIAAIVLEGKPTTETLYKVVIDRHGITVIADESLRNLTNHALCETLRNEHGGNASVISIGPAGEMRMATASIAITDQNFKPTRLARRGGVGAVMGAKGIKCIVLDPTGCKVRKPANNERFRAGNKAFVEALSANEITGHALPVHGVGILGEFIGGTTEQYDLHTTQDARLQRWVESHSAQIVTQACHRGCGVKCSASCRDKDGKFVAKVPCNEAIWAHGDQCGISDMDSISRLEFLDEDYGFDCIEMGIAISMLMQAGVIAYGDAEAAIAMVTEAGKGTPMGRIIGNGTVTTARCFGLDRVPTVKGQTIPFSSPTIRKGLGITCATSPQGADHTAGYSAVQDIPTNEMPYTGGPDWELDVSRNLQIATAALDSTGFCLFSLFAVIERPETFDSMVEVINGMYDLDMTGYDVLKLGKAVLETELDFNKQVGFTEADDRLPLYFSSKAQEPGETLFEVTDEELNAVHCA